MNYEQKYNEALEKARQLCAYPTTKPFISDLQDLFPELRESEDERIRKWLIEAINFVLEDGRVFHDKVIDEAKDAIAWLEKQGEQKPSWSEEDEHRVKDAIYFLDTAKKHYASVVEIDACIDWLKSIRQRFNEEKVNNAKKVEPKFKVGDWVILQIGELVIWKAGNLSPALQITNVDIDKKLYWFNDSSYLPIVDEECLHLWTIEDAKDGDVLCYEDEISLYKHDIKNCPKQETTFGGFVYHCCYDGKRFITDSFYSLTEQYKMGIHPATKEQRDLLFQKMKEAGYEWNEDKKELIKL